MQAAGSHPPFRGDRGAGGASLQPLSQWETFLGCFRTLSPTNLENAIGMIDTLQPDDAGGQEEGIRRELGRTGHHQKI